MYEDERNEEISKEPREDNNTVTLAGTITNGYTYSHEVFGEGFYTFELQAPRLSDAHDVLPITVSERIMDKALTVGAEVFVNGQLRSYNHYVAAEGRNRLILTVFARDYGLCEAGVRYAPNEVYLNGYICKPPMYRTTPFGREIADLLVAVNRSYNKSDYIPCIAWGRNARFSSKMSVGDNLRIWGRMQSRAYQKKQDDGSVQDKIAYEVSVAKLV